MEEKRGEAICDCEGNGETLPLASAPNLYHTVTHTHTHTCTNSPTSCPPPSPPVPNRKTTMYLTSCASPAILGVAAASPKMAPSERARTRGIRQGLCPPLGLALVNRPPVGSADGIRGSWVKKEEEEEGEGKGGGCSEPTVFFFPPHCFF